MCKVRAICTEAVNPRCPQVWNETEFTMKKPRRLFREFDVLVVAEDQGKNVILTPKASNPRRRRGSRRRNSTS
jgi:hypothetical protein